MYTGLGSVHVSTSLGFIYLEHPYLPTLPVSRAHSADRVSASRDPRLSRRAKGTMSEGEDVCLRGQDYLSASGARGGGCSEMCRLYRIPWPALPALIDVRVIAEVEVPT